MIIHMEGNNFVRDALTEFDRYFYATDMIVQSNANESHTYRVDQEAHVAWSVLVAGHTFSFDRFVSETELEESPLGANGDVSFTNDGHIKLKSVLHDSTGERDDWSSTAEGNYTQNGTEILFSILGCRVEGFSPEVDGWQEYPPEMQQQFSNMPASINEFGELIMSWYDNMSNPIVVALKLKN